LWRDANLDQERRWGKIGCGQDLVFAAATLDQPDEGLLADRGLRVITASGETLRCRDMVRAARALTGKMQIDLAREAGVSPTAVKAIETGRAPPLPKPSTKSSKRFGDGA
jgi:DNA-binding XRE family transcriptional regulator